MASSASPDKAGAQAERSRSQVVKAGRLPVTEFAFDRAGAASPFGDDLQFPLPLSQITYTGGGDRTPSSSGA
ncbi:MAG TPA: hypothetical protein VF054_03405 [Micromonosporaceae bacterium]